jgi:hypothetical protein
MFRNLSDAARLAHSMPPLHSRKKPHTRTNCEHHPLISSKTFSFAEVPSIPQNAETVRSMQRGDGKSLLTDLRAAEIETARKNRALEPAGLRASKALYFTG